MDDNKFKEDLASNNFTIETTRQRQNKTICPRTVADAVYINEEETLADRLNNISSLINNLEDYLNPLEIEELLINGNSERTTYPLGTYFYDLKLQWKYNKDISYQSINNELIDASLTEYSVPNKIQPEGPCVMNFKLEAKDKRINKIAKKEIEISFQNYIYITTAPEASRDLPSYIFLDSESRRNKKFIETLGDTYAVGAYSGYIWVALPLRFLNRDELGNYIDVTFTVNGFNGGFDGGANNPDYVFDMSNETGYKEPYVLYRSSQPKLGYTEFKISNLD